MQTDTRFGRLISLMVITIVGLSCNLPIPGAPEAQSEALQEIQEGSPDQESAAAPTQTLPPTAAPSPSASPEPTPTGGGGTTLFFLSDRDDPGGVLQIYRMDLVSRQPTQITSDALEKHNLAISPDGRWGAFVSGEYEKWLIYTVDLENSGEAVLVSPEMLNSGLPIWSPDSAWLAFTHRHLNCCSTVYIVKPDGSELTAISNKGDFNFQATWSPDSQLVGYTKMPTGGTFAGGPLLEFPQSYAARLDGSERTPIVEMENYMHYAPAWTPDGNAQIILAMDQMRQNYGLFLTNPQGGQPALFIHGESLGWMDEFDVVHTVFSPDGTRAAVAFLYPYGTGDKLNFGLLHVVNADGSSPQTLHRYTSESDPHVTIPSWTPDSASIVIEEMGQIYLLNVSSDERIQLTDSGENHAPVLVYDPAYVTLSQPSESEGESFSALDLQGSGRLAYVSDEAGSPEIFILNLDSGETSRLTRDLSKEQHLAWSPDGTQLAFISEDQWQARLFVADDETGSAHEVGDLPGSVYNPAWSPDGTQLLVVHQPDPVQLRTEIRQMNLASGQAENLVVDGNINRFPTWSPDGQQVAFSRRPLDAIAVGTLANWPETHLLDLSGGQAQQIASDEEFFERVPLWTPDGVGLFYIKVNTTNFQIQLAVSNINTGEEYIVVEKDQFTAFGNTSEYHWMGSWSPDGSRLGIITFAWDGETDFLGAVDVYVYNINTQELLLIDEVITTGYEGPSIQPPTWSPDGSLLLYTGFDLATETNIIFAADPATGAVRPISVSAHNTYAPAWTP
jgi:Tol biopolymer transport system component